MGFTLVIIEKLMKWDACQISTEVLNNTHFDQIITAQLH